MLGIRRVWLASVCIYRYFTFTTTKNSTLLERSTVESPLWRVCKMISMQRVLREGLFRPKLPLALADLEVNI
jgi:hypothetical protein